MKSKLPLLITLLALLIAVPVYAETANTATDSPENSSIKDTMNQNIKINADGKSTYSPPIDPRGPDTSNSNDDGKMYKGNNPKNVNVEDLGEIKNPTPEPELTSEKKEEQYKINIDSNATRDMTDIARKDFISHLKNDTELSTKEDLENYAKAVTVLDENVNDITADNTHVDVAYSIPAKFLWFINSSLSTHAIVSFDNATSGSATYMVSVKYPWYSVLFGVDKSAKSEVLGKLIESNLAAHYRDEIGVTRSGKAIKIISDVLKSVRANSSTSVSTDSSTATN